MNYVIWDKDKVDLKMFCSYSMGGNLLAIWDDLLDRYDVL